MDSLQIDLHPIVTVLFFHTLGSSISSRLTIEQGRTSRVSTLIIPTTVDNVDLNGRHQKGSKSAKKVNERANTIAPKLVKFIQ
jgi:hypothetical protein